LTTYSYDDSGRLISYVRDATRYFVVTDLAGTPEAITDGAGNVIGTLTRGAFGVHETLTGTMPIPIGYAGGVEDPVTGIVHLGLRDYDPATARWLEPDPTLYTSGAANLYSYAWDDPVDYSDTTGEGPSNLEGKCNRIAARIANLEAELVKRVDEWTKNEGLNGGGPLPECHANGSLLPYKSTHGGHALLIGIAETNLANAIADWNNSGCNGPPPTTPVVVSKTTSAFTNAAAATAATAATAAGAAAAAEFLGAVFVLAL
jgi:RHS repeat-associated protein